MLYECYCFFSWGRGTAVEALMIVKLWKMDRRVFYQVLSLRSGSIVTNEGKPRCAFASKFDLVVVDLR